jgi:hypothetical protein
MGLKSNDNKHRIGGKIVLPYILLYMNIFKSLTLLKNPEQHKT